MLTEREKDAVHRIVCGHYRGHLARGGARSSPYACFKEFQDEVQRQCIRRGTPLDDPYTIMLDVAGKRITADLREVAPGTFGRAHQHGQ